MRIAIDVQPLQYGARDAGIGRYLRHFLDELGPIAKGHDIRLLVNGRVDSSRDLKLAAPGRWRVITLDRPRVLGDRGWIAERLGYSRLLRAAGLDVFHANSVAELHGITTPRPTRRCRVVVTVHDIIPWLFRAEHEAYWPRRPFSYDYRRKLRDVACADRILVPSEHTRRDLAEQLGIPGDRVAVIPNGVEARFRPVRDEACLGAVRRAYGLPDLFILYVGGYYSPRKNIEGLLDAFARFLEEPGTDGVQLVLAGARGARGSTAAALRRRLEEPLLHDRVVTTEFVADEDMPALYSAASIVVYPSLYEGFGLPPLEAMACGTPVVTSGGSSLGALVGEAAVRVDSRDPGAISAALLGLWRDPARRGRLVEAGLARSRDFSWRRTAERTLAVYEQVFTAGSTP
jgi:glycosyltransferase involved in cell wall biosynthesis